MFRRIAAVCAQDETYAHRFRQLGAPADRVSVTGTMKFDTAQVSDRVDGDDQLAAELGLTVTAASGSRGPSSSSENEPRRPPATGTEPLWVCGSTGPGEEQFILDAYEGLRRQHSNLRLAIIPRHPQRFDEVAALIQQRGLPLLRRSARTPAPPGTQPVILGDTMGELRKFYSLADVVLVGRSLVDLGPRQHGSDMIEPAALAKPIVVGPWTHNFAEPMQKLRDAHAIREIAKHIPSELRQTIDDWLKDPTVAAELGKRAQQVVRENQGATARHAELILNHLPSESRKG
jgi:3-deoxy-D-manno-octulosonic-acid transferase